jgi:hypothetical protein
MDGIISNLNTRGDCSICFDPLPLSDNTLGDSRHVISCKNDHPICSECFQSWYDATRKAPTCGQCRTKHFDLGAGLSMSQMKRIDKAMAPVYCHFLGPDLFDLYFLRCYSQVSSIALDARGTDLKFQLYQVSNWIIKQLLNMLEFGGEVNLPPVTYNVWNQEIPLKDFKTECKCDNVSICNPAEHINDTCKFQIIDRVEYLVKRVLKYNKIHKEEHIQYLNRIYHLGIDLSSHMEELVDIQLDFQTNLREIENWFFIRKLVEINSAYVSGVSGVDVPRVIPVNKHPGYRWQEFEDHLFDLSNELIVSNPQAAHISNAPEPTDHLLTIFTNGDITTYGSEGDEELDPGFMQHLHICLHRRVSILRRANFNAFALTDAERQTVAIGRAGVANVDTNGMDSMSAEAKVVLLSDLDGLMMIYRRHRRPYLAHLFQ